MDTPTPDAGATFDRSMVRTESVTKESKGGQSNVRFVADTVDYEEIVSLTDQCVKSYLAETAAAYCYGYANAADYEVTAFDWTPESDQDIYGTGRPCWIMYSGQPVAGADGRTDTPAIATSFIDQCPGGVEFPDPDGSLADYREKRESSLAAATDIRRRDVCALIDTEALTRNGFNATLGDVTDDPTAYLPDGASASWVCSTAEGEVGFTATEFADPASAAGDVESAELATNDFLLDAGRLIALDGGSAIVNDEFGLVEAAWSVGTVSFSVTMSSVPVTPGLSGGQSNSELADAITSLASTAAQRVAADAW
ncbi:hypothetical protein R4172_15480 [Rhodococcus kroppenstedtii]|uniref:hypothetical protein n=1 Tax=Rhodococcoides kroppenstedtii TaxID=293050 RepID=UPI002953C579|nr:hypothetical protein [Rhodococcus kroppenstedtii]MDV7198952.1 hypothetical protein [Rhodococcus kroppenstedtii]